MIFLPNMKILQLFRRFSRERHFCRNKARKLGRQGHLENCSAHTHCRSRRLALITPWCRTFFEKFIVTQLFKKQPAFFMKPEGSLPCSQKPTTWPYPEPAESSSLHRILSPQDPFKSCLPNYAYVFQMVSSLQDSQTKPCKQLSPTPYMPHIPPTLSSMI
jgi:hypothetical protein